MIVPYLTQSVSGLRRTGPFRWRSSDDDPQFRFPLKLYRPRHLVLVLDGLDRPVVPQLYFDDGLGFEEEASAEFPAAGRFVCRVDLCRMPDVRRLRLDPLPGPGEVRLTAWATDLRAAAILLVRRLVPSQVETGPTRVFLVMTPTLSTTPFGSGRERRHFRNTAEHYAEVLAMPRAAMPTADEAAAPLVSLLVPTFNTKPAYLDDLLKSVRQQPPGMVDLIFSDDGSTSATTRHWLGAQDGQDGVQVVWGARNGGIAQATNAALAQVRTPWVSLLDHDDALSAGAIEMVARAIRERPEAQFLYTDEVAADQKLAPQGYLLKPAYDPVLLSGVNYMNHLSVYRTERLRALGGLRDGFQGSQDYDLLLRYLDGLAPRTIVHVPYPAYRWRRHPASYSTTRLDASVASARRALGEHFGRPRLPVPVTDALSPGLHRVRFDLVQDTWPSVTIVIPSRNGFELVARLLDGLESRTDYPGVEIVVVDNGSDDPRVLALYAETEARHPAFRADIVVEPFNFSRSINRGIGLASGHHIVLMNNDIEIEGPGWLKEMVSCLAYRGTGIVGVRLLYPDRTIQHAGVIVGAGDLAGHWFERKPESFVGPLGRLGVRQTMSAVTGAAMLISRACLEAVGPWDEENFAIAYNDVDYCLRAAEHGFRTVWTPFATLIHHESATRGSDETPTNLARFRQEQANLKARHDTPAFSDPVSNPWYTRDRSVPALRALDELPGPR